MALSCFVAAFRASSADRPIPFTGFNQDVVVERSATNGNTAPYAQVWDRVAYYGFYEAGLSNIGVWPYGNGSEGLPEGGVFVSLLDGETTFQLGPYNGSNVLYLSQSSPSGTLVLTHPKALQSLSILAASANGGTNGSFVIRFADGSVSEPLSYSARDWYGLSGPVALSQYGSIVLGRFDAFYTDDLTGYPNLYQTTVDLAARGLHTNEIVSLTFTRPTGPGTSSSTTSGIFALSGTPALRLAIELQWQLYPWLNLSWDAIPGLHYQIQYQTNLNQTNWLDLGNPILATNSTGTLSNSIGSDYQFYRVFQLP